MRVEGEYELVDGAQTYRLRFDMNSLVDIEDAFGVNAMQFLQDEKRLDGLTVKETRTMFHICFAAYHPDVTLLDAGRIMSRHSGALMAVMQAALPQGDAAAGGDEGNVAAA